MLAPAEIHIVMRFSDSVGPAQGTIEAHLEVLGRHGAVWFGKMGKTLSASNIETLNAQVRNGVATHLYLVQRHGSRYGVHRCTIQSVSKSAPGQKRLFP